MVQWKNTAVALLAALLAGLGLALSAQPGEAGVYNLHLVTDSVPDYTDMPSLVRSATDLWQTPQEQVHRRLAMGPPQPPPDQLRRGRRPRNLGPHPALQLLRRDELRHHLLAEHRLLAGNWAIAAATSSSAITPSARSPGTTARPGTSSIPR